METYLKIKIIKEFGTATKAAKQLNVSRMTLYRMAKDGRLEEVLDNGHTKRNIRKLES